MTHYDAGPCHYCGRITDRASLVCWQSGDPIPEGEDGLEWLCATCDHYTANPVQVLPASGREMSDETDVPF